ncbi:LysE family translocator [Aquitalea sp. LB_tupeE]|uniref:LysE family translocator n=1 Tax=Aquitalea sp. LB_tupeE TaxID=2748078 RepID=UPI0015C0ED92|nr:LysE family translocator [Aquitalea sp. LB_tupeE]NWK78812.1 LysE family translocator [Aquitalea sp. LB_tupeE]
MTPPASFFIAALTLAIIPGPGIAFVAAKTVSCGKAAGIASSLGTSLGGMLHVLAAALGLSLLIVKSPLAYGIVKYVGASYLIYIGLKAWNTNPTRNSAESVQHNGFKKAWLDGVMVEFMNIKTAMFFLAFIPQFIQPYKPVAYQFVIMGTICVLLNTSVDILAVFLAHKLKSKENNTRKMNQISGLIMFTLGFMVVIH